MENFTERKTPAGLYSPRFEHDNCGIGAVVDIKWRKSHKTIDDALSSSATRPRSCLRSSAKRRVCPS